MNQLVIAVLWAIVGAAAGLGLRWGSVKLARLEGLEPGSKWWQRFGPPVLAAVVFAVYGYELSPFGILLVRSVFALVLVQVVFFDFEREVMLGEPFWDFVGGPGTYEELLEVYRQVGEDFAGRLRELREQLA